MAVAKVHGLPEERGGATLTSEIWNGFSWRVTLTPPRPATSAGLIVRVTYLSIHGTRGSLTGGTKVATRRTPNFSLGYSDFNLGQSCALVRQRSPSRRQRGQNSALDGRVNEVADDAVEDSATVVGFERVPPLKKVK